MGQTTMKILLTGATGFVGQALSATLVNGGEEVFAAIRHKKGIAVLPSGTNPVLVGSIDSGTDWRSALKGVDVVIHLATQAPVIHDTNDNRLSALWEVNVHGTEKLALSAAALGVRRFVYISSIKVNGEGKTRPYGEVSTPNPLDLYGQSKWEAEKILHGIASETGMEIVILRPPVIYGPGVKANFLRLLQIVDREIPLPFGAMHNKRSMIYLGNMVHAIISCATNEKAAGNTFLVSDGQDISTPQLVRMMAKKMDKKARLFPCPPTLLRVIGKICGKSAEIERLTGSLCIDDKNFRSTLDWQPPYSLKQGIEGTVNWFQGSGY